MLLSEYHHYDATLVTFKQLRATVEEVHQRLNLDFDKSDISFDHIQGGGDEASRGISESSHTIAGEVKDWDQLEYIQSYDDFDKITVDGELVEREDDVSYMWLHMSLGHNDLSLETVWLRFMEDRVILKLAFRDRVLPTELNNFRKECIEIPMELTSKRRTITLGLSGGGFRATFYHLGVIKLLRDAKMLRDVTHISAVSGGSILAAHLVLNWEKYTSKSEDDFEGVVKSLILCGKSGLRNKIHLRRSLVWPLSLIIKMAKYCSPRTESIRLLLLRVSLRISRGKDQYYKKYNYSKQIHKHTNWGDRTQILANFYDKYLFKKCTLDDLGGHEIDQLIRTLRKFL